MEQNSNIEAISEAAKLYASDDDNEITEIKESSFYMGAIWYKQFISEQKPLDDKNSVHWTHLFLPVLLNYKNGLVNENGVMSWLEIQVFKPLANCIPDEEQKPLSEKEIEVKIDNLVSELSYRGSITDMKGKIKLFVESIKAASNNSK